jgi:hypothetical protein
MFHQMKSNYHSWLMDQKNVSLGGQMVIQGHDKWDQD